MNQSNITSEPTHEQRDERLRRLAVQQNVRPLSFDELKGDAKASDPEKENVDDFSALRRQWREDDAREAA